MADPIGKAINLLIGKFLKMPEEEQDVLKEGFKQAFTAALDEAVDDLFKEVHDKFKSSTELFDKSKKE